ncbi:MAG: cytochrome c3 family protein [Candidatus Zipacnadales bacterium]
MKLSLGKWSVAALILSFICLEALLAIAQDARPRIPDDAKYVTSKLCGMCHEEEATAFAKTPHFNHEPPAETDEPWKHNTGWNKETSEAAEAGIRCEACHGRGSAHVKADQDEKAGLIINSMILEDNAVRVSICAQCHARYTAKEGEVPVAYVPGENLLEKIELLPVEEGLPHQELNEMIASKHFTLQHMGCIQCHTSHAEEKTEHSLRKPLPDLCVQCHQEQADLAHTKGQAKEGDTCATCHMPNGAHTFAKASTE